MMPTMHLQATFFGFWPCKAVSYSGVGESLAPWLYAVAFRTVQRARAVASRYRPVPAGI